MFFLAFTFAAMTAEEIKRHIENNKYEAQVNAEKLKKLQEALDAVRADIKNAQACLDEIKAVKKTLNDSLDENEGKNGFAGDIKKDLIDKKGKAAIGAIDDLIRKLDQVIDSMVDMETNLVKEINGNQDLIDKFQNWLYEAKAWLVKLTNN